MKWAAAESLCRAFGSCCRVRRIWRDRRRHQQHAVCRSGRWATTTSRASAMSITISPSWKLSTSRRQKLSILLKLVVPILIHPSALKVLLLFLFLFFNNPFWFDFIMINKFYNYIIKIIEYKLIVLYISAFLFAEAAAPSGSPSIPAAPSSNSSKFLKWLLNLFTWCKYLCNN